MSFIWTPPPQQFHIITMFATKKCLGRMSSVWTFASQLLHITTMLALEGCPLFGLLLRSFSTSQPCLPWKDVLYLDFCFAASPHHNHACLGRMSSIWTPPEWPSS